MPQNFKKYIFIFSILLLFAHLSPIRAEEKAVPEGLSTAEWLECIDQVVNEFNPPIKACLEKNRYRSGMCDTITAQQNEASDKEIKIRCVAVPKRQIPSSSTEQTAQDQSSNNNQTESPNYTRALVKNPPEESDFQKIPKSEFNKVNPEGTASATPKLATQSAKITSDTFIGKVGGEGKILIDLPDGETVTLTNDRTAYDGKLSAWKWIRGVDQILKKPNLQISIYQQDCHLEIRQANQAAWASDWSTSIKRSDNCTYGIEEDPIRILTDTGKTTIETPSGITANGEKADFGAYFDTTSKQSVIEIYNGSITVTDKDGNSKTISTVYGSDIKRIEVDKNGEMNEKIAIPQSQWEAFLSSKQDKKDEAKGNTLPIVGAVAVFGLGGIVFFLYRTGKLLPLFEKSKQKISDILQKILKEKKAD